MPSDLPPDIPAGEPSLHETVVDNLYDGVYYVDLHRRITYWNRGAERISGYGPDETVGRNCMDNLLAHVDAAGNELCRTMCPLSETLSDGRLREKSVYLRHRDGHRVPVDVRAAPIRDTTGKVVGAVEIFTEDTRAELTRQQLEQLRNLAMGDALTGIPNRRYLEMTLRSRLDDLARFGFPFGVLFADIDHFKAVNDDHGHEAGDGVLRVVANTLRSGVRSTDVVGRWGGEEFVVLAAAVDGSGLADLAECCRALVASAHARTGEHVVQVTISIGGVMARDGESAEDVIARADRLMYRSKDAGRDRITVE